MMRRLFLFLFLMMAACPAFAQVSPQTNSQFMATPSSGTGYLGLRAITPQDFNNGTGASSTTCLSGILTWIACTGGIVGPSSTVVGDIALWNNTTGTLLNDSGKAVPAGVIVGTTDTQTLTNKSIVASALTVAPSAGYSAMVLSNPAAGTDHQIYGTVNGLSRWLIDPGTSAAETGSNAGSDFSIQRYSDTGTLIDSPMSIKRSTGVATFTDGLAPGTVSKNNGTISVLDCGAVDDNATDNTTAVQTCVNTANSGGKTLRFPFVTTGAYRMATTINWNSVNIDLDNGVQILTTTGGSYTGGYAGSIGLGNVVAPGSGAFGQNNLHITSPGSNWTYTPTLQAQSAPAFQAHQIFDGASNGTTVSPYVGFGPAFYGYTSVGASGNSASGSGGIFGGNMNVFNANNGPGVNITCNTTSGSTNLTGCSSIAYIFDPAKITGAGIPTNTYMVPGGAVGSTITMSAAATATATGVAINVVSGRGEITPLTYGVNFSNTVNMPGMSIYTDLTHSSNASTNAADQEGYLSGLTDLVIKWAPGNVLDRLHQGSFGEQIVTRPGAGGYDFNNRTGESSYEMNAMLQLAGWSGPVGTSGGDASNATPASYIGLQVGGPGCGVWCPTGARSRFEIGAQIGDYTGGGLYILNPISGFSTFGIDVEANAGTNYFKSGTILGNSAFSGAPVSIQNSTGTCAHTPGSSSEVVSCTSDERLKKDIVDTDDHLKWLDSFRIRDFTLKADGSRRTGVIAQEVQARHPEMVHAGNDGMFTVDQPDPWRMMAVMQDMRQQIIMLWMALGAMAIFMFGGFGLIVFRQRLWRTS